MATHKGCPGRRKNCQGNHNVKIWEFEMERNVTRILTDICCLLFISITVLTQVGCSQTKGGPTAEVSPESAEPTSQIIVNASPTVFEPEPPTATEEAALSPPPTLTPTPDFRSHIELPAAVYFIGEDWQIWRMETDGQTTRITHEAQEVLDFDISPDGNWLAYSSGNRLMLLDRAGEGPAATLVQGPVVSEQPNITWNWTVLNDVRWSPDGSRIAYGLGGVNIFDVASGISTSVLPSYYRFVDEFTRVDPAFFYWPEAWSEDGSGLLVFFNEFPASGNGILDMASRSFVRITTPDAQSACCRAVWGAGDESVFSASKFSGYTPIGLWQADPTTGESITLLDDMVVDYPAQSSTGELYFFAVPFRQELMDEPRPAFSLYQMALDTLEPVQLRTDSYEISEALWVPHRPEALIVDMFEGNPGYSFITHPFIGDLIWLPANEPAVWPETRGRRPQWGP